MTIFTRSFSPVAKILQPAIAQGFQLQPSLIFIDIGVTDLPRCFFNGKRAELIFLSGKEDGLDEIAHRSRVRRRLTCMHILAGFARGRLTLGGRALRLRDFQGHAEALAQIGLAFAPGGTLLIGAGESGDGESDYVLGVLKKLIGVPVRLWRPAA